jgi:phosphoglycerate dehydrogenase-like enzyme
MHKPHILYLTVRRHPEGLRSIVEREITRANLDFTVISYEEIHKLSDMDLSKFDAVLLAPARYLDIKILKNLTNSKLLQIWSSGFDKFNLVEAKTHGHQVANNGGSNGQSVAEHTLNLILGVSRRNYEMHQRVLEGKWDGNDHGLTSRSLYGKVLGLIGFGNIGQKVGDMASTFGMKYIFFDSNPDLEQHERFRSLDEILSMSDYISLHIHLNESTRNILSKEQFLQMERRPFIINVSRAELIERQALVNAMKSGQIAGCAMDVHYEEPNNFGDELYKFPNTLFSPHIAGSTFDIYQEAVSFCINNICAALDGAKINSLI